jgi:hypothetical protein
MRTPGPGDAISPEYWEAVLKDPLADPSPMAPGVPIQARQLSDISQHMLRVSCARCDRTVEIQKADAVRLYGRSAVWKQVGQRLLDDTCQQRTGSHEDDGCWPSFE